MTFMRLNAEEKIIGMNVKEIRCKIFEGQLLSPLIFSISLTHDKDKNITVTIIHARFEADRQNIGRTKTKQKNSCKQLELSATIFIYSLYWTSEQRQLKKGKLV